MADGMSPPGDSAGLHVIRCTECLQLVPADRVRHREERTEATPASAPGRWRAGGPPIFRPTTRSQGFAHNSTSRAQAATSPCTDDAIARVPICVDCLRRQRMGLYGVCGIVAVCFAVAVALYSHEQTAPRTQPVTLATDAPGRPATPASTAVPNSAGAFDEDVASAIGPMWQPISDAAAKLFASTSATSAPASEPETEAEAVPAPEKAPPIAASPAKPDTPASPPAAEPAPAQETAESVPSAAAPAADVTEAASATSSEPPIWATERKPSRKLAKATLPVRRDEPAAANGLAMRNDGYAALQERRYRDALALLQQATMMGDPYAPMYIGQIFENGTGVPRDVGQASYWYGIAINRGNGAALAAFNRMRVNPY